MSDTTPMDDELSKVKSDLAELQAKRTREIEFLRDLFKEIEECLEFQLSDPTYHLSMFAARRSARRMLEKLQKWRSDAKDNSDKDNTK